ncbi:hypothetical protein EGN72_04305 [Pseudorhodobacter sp. E13]|uniref:hypothetical protein n=1 Tax=Pseudorhodobacter sp. E13 TaxID=2487931 RepID=UPI000F8E7D1C|nr:hypothetical protein [Pseudorhodobacter sp. E13]RUS63463.1 hypothetical protein EGN72_04305 [Pseudorhodobacter sp. E13]
MNRRKLLGLGVVALLSAAMPALADSLADNVVAQLKRRGFKRITVGRTFLGRTRIVAVGNGGRREIILNPRTNEILRDLWIAEAAGSGGGSSGGVLSNGGASGDDDDDHDDKDDDDDDDDDDHEDRDDKSGKGDGGGDDDDDDD